MASSHSAMWRPPYGTGTEYNCALEPEFQELALLGSAQAESKGTMRDPSIINHQRNASGLSEET